jgi:predicted HTH domain antitoxin
MSKVLAIQVEVPDAVSEQSLRVAEAIARQSVVLALQQQGDLTVREAAALLGVTYEQYLQLLAARDLGVSRFEQDPMALQVLRQNLPSCLDLQP